MRGTRLTQLRDRSRRARERSRSLRLTSQSLRESLEKLRSHAAGVNGWQLEGSQTAPGPAGAESPLSPRRTALDFHAYVRDRVHRARVEAQALRRRAADLRSQAAKFRARSEDLRSTSASI